MEGKISEKVAPPVWGVRPWGEIFP